VANVVGVILAGGTGSRLKPLTNGINKNILPVGNKPMLLYPIEKLKEAGITKICVVTGVEHIGAVVGLLRSGEDYGVDTGFKRSQMALLRLWGWPKTLSAGIIL